MEKDNHQDITCSFCGKKIPENVLAAQGIGTDVFICQDCINDVHKTFADADSYIETVEDEQKREEKKNGRLPRPSEIKAHLDQYIEGQDLAKRVLSVAVYNHYKMLNAKLGKKAINKEVELEKSNILLAGPSGCGKTAILKALAKYLKVPFVIADATEYTSAGYVGKDVECIMRDMISAANGDIKKAERGIVYIDEIDKTSRKGENLSTTSDPGHEGTQQSLLKLLEGSQVDVPMDGRRLNPESRNLSKIDTTNMLFIVGGAFEGIEKIIAKRMRQGKSSIGIGAKLVDKNNDKFNDFIENLSTDDLKKFGMLPELLGRVPVIAPLKELTEDQLVNILHRPKNALIKQYQELFAQDGVELEVTEEAMKLIAQKALKRKTGARGLRGLMEDILNPVMFSIPDREENYVLVDVKDGKIEVKYDKKATKRKAV
jgi:ATP-dependent Clp protease ATP-binding subunit ClpX